MLCSLQCSKLSARSAYQRPKHATGGPGMQAVFLVSGQGSCGGTGVFLPQKAGTKSTRKPGLHLKFNCSLKLVFIVPYRVKVSQRSTFYTSSS